MDITYKNFLKVIINGEIMDEKNKSALVFCLTGGITGVISGSVLKGTASELIFLIAIMVIYLTTYIVPLIGVNMERMGGRRKVITSGMFSFLMWWLTLWFLIYNIA